MLINFKIDAFRKDIENSIMDISQNYNPYLIEFAVGDEVWYAASVPRKAVITAIDDYSEGGEIPGGLVYYWINFEGAKLSIFDYIRYYWAYLKGSVYFPPKDFIGHAILAGEDIFRTKAEATIIGNLYNLRYHLINLKDIT